MEEFVSFPKIARLSREVVVTEKIDGTNAQIYIVELDGYSDPDSLFESNGLALYAGSRNRWVTRENDNFGFADWCYRNGDELLGMGPGRHFGEWWGLGIQRGYGLNERRFSLFNVQRWQLYGTPPERMVTQDPTVVKYKNMLPECCNLVPVVWRGNMDDMNTEQYLVDLSTHGSLAAPGYMHPEGIVVYHTASGSLFKKTILKDDMPKGKS